ncbi:MAG: hypothetical protein U0T83_02880 [Bacteriovoracaceae bacterium]
MIFKYLVILTFLISQPLLASETVDKKRIKIRRQHDRPYKIKVGIGPTYVNFSPFKNEKSHTKGDLSEQGGGLAFVSHAGFEYEPFSFYASAYLNFAYPVESYHQFPRFSFYGSGDYLNTAFGLSVHYITQIQFSSQLLNGFRNQENLKQRVYFGGSLLTSLQKFHFESTKYTKGYYKDEVHVAYTAHGFALSLGIEDIEPAHNDEIEFLDYPLFVELNYVYLRANKMSVLGGSKWRVETLEEHKLNDFQLRTYMLSLVVGVKLFKNRIDRLSHNTLEQQLV